MPRISVRLPQNVVSTPPRKIARTSSFLADLALLVGLPGPTGSPTATEPYVPPLTDVHDVLAVLQGPIARNNPPYVLSVLKSYVRSRPARRSCLENDLVYLAGECPEFAPEFRAILKHFRLPLPPELLHQSQLHSYNSPYHTAPRTRHCHWRQGAAAAFRNAGPGVARMMSPSADPPPPYASEDPDPDNTAIQALRLAAQSRINLGDLAGIAQASRVDLVELAARSQVDLQLLSSGEQEPSAGGWAGPGGAPNSTTSDGNADLLRRHAELIEGLEREGQLVRPSQDPGRLAAQQDARQEALRRLEGPPRPPKAATRLAPRQPSMPSLRTERQVVPAFAISTPPRSPRAAAGGRGDRSSISSLSALVKRRFSSTLSGTFSGTFSNRTSASTPAATAPSSPARSPPRPPPRPPRRDVRLSLPLPIIPPLSLIGPLDFEREFDDLISGDDWLTAREAGPLAHNEEEAAAGEASAGYKDEELVGVAGATPAKPHSLSLAFRTNPNYTTLTSSTLASDARTVNEEGELEELLSEPEGASESSHSDEGSFDVRFEVDQPFDVEVSSVMATEG